MEKPEWNLQVHLADEVVLVWFLILRLIPACWFIDRTGCTVYDDTQQSRFPLPDFFHFFLPPPTTLLPFAISIDCFFPYHFPGHVCRRKCIKGAAFNLGGCTGNATSDPDLAWKTRRNCAENRDKPAEKETSMDFFCFPAFSPPPFFLGVRRSWKSKLRKGILESLN